MIVARAGEGMTATVLMEDVKKSGLPPAKLYEGSLTDYKVRCARAEPNMGDAQLQIESEVSFSYKSTQ